MDGESFKRLIDDYRGKFIANKYLVLSGLGFGNFAVVFLGYEPYRKRLVAIKRFLLPRAEVQPVIGEINGMDVLSGKRNIVQFFGYEVEELDPDEKSIIDGGMEDHLRFYIIMEYGGETLEKYLRHHGPGSSDGNVLQLDPDDLFRAFLFTRDILRGLAGSHQEHIVHRDIKPLNIYISLDGEACIGDFGVAKQVLQEGLHSGTVVGTAQYMAPEQVSEGIYSANVDLFATGVTLYRMLTGELPFRTTGELLAKEPALDIPGLSPMAVDILRKALEKDPRARYQTAAVMLREVDAWGSELEKEHGSNQEGMHHLIGSQIRDLIGEELLETIRKAKAGEEIVASSSGPDQRIRQPSTGPDVKQAVPDSIEDQTTEPPRDQVLKQPIRPVELRMTGMEPARRARKYLRASDRSLASGDLAGALRHLEHAPPLEGEPARIIADQSTALRILVGWEHRVDEESLALIEEKRYLKAEAAILPLVKIHRHSRLSERLKRIRTHHDSTVRILDRAEKKRRTRRYGAAVRLYRKALGREPHLTQARDGLYECRKLLSRARRRNLRRLAGWIVVVSLLGAGTYLFRSEIAPVVVDGGTTLQGWGWYTRPPVLNARDMFRLAAVLDSGCDELAPARTGLRRELMQKAGDAASRGELESAKDLREQALLLADEP